MLKKLATLLPCLLLTSPLIAGSISIPAPGYSLDYVLDPQSAEAITNPFLSDYTFMCQYELQEPQVVINVQVLKRSAEINDKPISEGDVFDITISNGESMKILARSRSSVQLTNLGKYAVTAHCSTM